MVLPAGVGFRLPGARVTRGTERGGEGELMEVLTSRDGGRQLDFGEGRTGAGAWLPARVPVVEMAPQGISRDSKRLPETRLVVAHLLEALASSHGVPTRQLGGDRPQRARLSLQTMAALWRPVCYRKGGERAAPRRDTPGEVRLLR
jgi:hypothetical protein